MSEVVINRLQIASLIGYRATQIDNGAPIFVDYDKTKIFDSKEIAKREFEEGVIPLEIHRTMPNGDKEIIRFKPKK